MKHHQVISVYYTTATLNSQCLLDIFEILDLQKLNSSYYLLISIIVLTILQPIIKKLLLIKSLFTLITFLLTNSNSFQLCYFADLSMKKSLICILK